MSVAIVLIGVLTFGVICRISKWVNSDHNEVSEAFGKTVALVVEDFEDSNLQKGYWVIVETIPSNNLAEGDYVVYNDLYSKFLRNDNCGQIQSIKDDFVFIKSENNSEVTKMSLGLCLGKLQFGKQVECGWLRFVSSVWCDVVFILLAALGLCGISGYFIYEKRKQKSIKTP